jgi:hypothetical protein
MAQALGSGTGTSREARTVKAGYFIVLSPTRF